MEIGLTPRPPPIPPFPILPILLLFVFFWFLKERNNERWNLYLKKSKKHIDVKTKNKEEVEGVHDNASAFMHLNIKTHK